MSNPIVNPIVRYIQKQLFGQKGVIANNKTVSFEAAKLAEKLSETLLLNRWLVVLTTAS